MNITKAAYIGAKSSYLASQQLAQNKPVTTPQQQEAAVVNASADSANGAKNLSATDTVKVTPGSVALGNLDTVRTIGQMHVKLNQLAKEAREADESLNRIAEQTRKMRGNTLAITKNFPPFSREDKERQQILLSYTSLAKEIAKMTVPTPPPPVYERVKHQWESTFDRNGQLLPTAVPSLQTDSSDQDVESAGSALEHLGKKLADLSTATTQALIAS
jgi:hypothetical protein